MKIKNYLSVMQSDKIMFLETVKQTSRRRRGMWITQCNLLAILLLLVTCNFQSKKPYIEDVTESLLSPLDSGVVNYKDKQPFETFLHLKGKKVNLSDSLLKDIGSISFIDNHVVLHKYFPQFKIAKFPIGNDEFICIRPSDSLIIRATSDGDYKKNFNLKMWPNDGSLMVNSSKNRVVFAYKYFHLFHIMDMEAKMVKTIEFSDGNHHKKFAITMGGHDTNTTYYVDSFAGDEYFYLLYWGHSYSNLANNIYKGWQKTHIEEYTKPENYQWNLPNIVEQYDWNGNPAGKYILEGNSVRHGDCFVVDEKRQLFYLLTSECDKFYPYVGFAYCNNLLIAYQF